MRKSLLLLLLTFATFGASAQTFERPYYSYSLTSLPKKPFDRSIVNTYSPMVKLDPGMKPVFNEYESCGWLNMAGFKKWL